MDTQKIYEQVENEFACDCLDTTIACRVCSNGVRQFVRQCTECGRCSKALPKSALTPRDLALALPINVELHKERSEARMKRQNELHQEWRNRANEDWWKRYDEYLQSEKWKSKRERVLKRDGDLCQACLQRTATQVHHLSYKHVFREPLFELTSVCDLCHRAITQMDRGEVPTT